MWTIKQYHIAQYPPFSRGVAARFSAIRSIVYTYLARLHSAFCSSSRLLKGRRAPVASFSLSLLPSPFLSLLLSRFISIVLYCSFPFSPSLSLSRFFSLSFFLSPANLTQSSERENEREEEKERERGDHTEKERQR